MADNRQYTDHNEIGGVNVYLEDKKLSEISTKTTVSSEGVMLKGTDGAYYEIDKASLSEVIRAELGAILAAAGKNNGTSVSKVPTLNSNNNALGASSIADLASVLGVQNIDFGYNHSTFEAAANSGSFNKLLFGKYGPDVTYLVIGFRNGNYGAFIGFTYDNTPDVKKLCQIYNDTFTWY